MSEETRLFWTVVLCFLLGGAFLAYAYLLNLAWQGKLTKKCFKKPEKAVPFGTVMPDETRVVICNPCIEQGVGKTITQKIHLAIAVPEGSEFAIGGQYWNAFGVNSKAAKELVYVRESLALMAEGEGPDPEVYMNMSKGALDKLDALLLQFGVDRLKLVKEIPCP